MAIKDWHEDDRPREKLIRLGARNLSVAELIAILIGSGNREESALDLSKKLLQSVDYQLDRLENMSLENLQSFKGIGQAKSVVLNAAFELGRRRAEQKSREIKKIRSASEAYHLLKPVMDNLNHEEFWVIFLRKNKVLGMEKVMQGGLDFSQVDLRLFWKRVLDMNATEIIVAHNHPSGNLEPSRADIQLTKKLIHAGENLSVVVLDHLIISHENYQSVFKYL